MKVVIAGFGTAGTARLAAYAGVEGADVVAVVDPSPARRAAARSAGVSAYPELAALPGSDRPDVVDVCAPPSYHRLLTMAALDAGSHVICEKPVAFRTADALAMAAASRRAGRLLYPAHNYLFSPMMGQLRECAATAGTPQALRIRIERQTHAKGSRGYQPDWRRDLRIAGGGILLDHGSHCVYMATRLFGEPPAKVSALARWQTEGLDEAMNVRLHFPHGTADIELSWVGERRTNLYALTGPAGSVTITDGTARLIGPGGTEERALESPTGSSTHEEWFAGLFADFTAVLCRPAAWERPLADVISTTEIIEAAYTSARLHGEPVPIREG
ncbi:Gfo/Idh/MocA family protein [Nonomuraea sp. 10N515B]|uniref:Gfo/Idh/MocA family protein n=1 Tax=Nonomuraea sp. 10N515B TaxID=3457422 RepID=UPI003FCD22AE